MAGQTIEITAAAGWDGIAETLERLAADGVPECGPRVRLAAGDYSGARQRADAGRIGCAWLAAVAHLDAAAVPGTGDRPDPRPDRDADGPPSLAEALVDLDAALGAETGDGPDGAAGLRALFHAEVRAMADTLSLLDPEAAAPVLGQRLAQDWSRLPAAAAERVRAACLTPGTRVLAALAGAGDAAGWAHRTAPRRPCRPRGPGHPPGAARSPCTWPPTPTSPRAAGWTPRGRRAAAPRGLGAGRVHGPDRTGGARAR